MSIDTISYLVEVCLCLPQQYNTRKRTTLGKHFISEYNVKPRTALRQRSFRSGTYTIYACASLFQKVKQVSIEKQKVQDVSNRVSDQTQPAGHADQHSRLRVYSHFLVVYVLKRFNKETQQKFIDRNCHAKVPSKRCGREPLKQLFQQCSRQHARPAPEVRLSTKQRNTHITDSAGRASKHFSTFVPRLKRIHAWFRYMLLA